MLKNLARIGAASVAAGALALLGLAGTAGASTSHVSPAIVNSTVLFTGPANSGSLNTNTSPWNIPCGVSTTPACTLAMAGWYTQAFSDLFNQVDATFTLNPELEGIGITPVPPTAPPLGAVGAQLCNSTTGEAAQIGAVYTGAGKFALGYSTGTLDGLVGDPCVGGGALEGTTFVPALQNIPVGDSVQVQISQDSHGVTFTGAVVGGTSNFDTYVSTGHEYYNEAGAGLQADTTGLSAPAVNDLTDFSGVTATDVNNGITGGLATWNAVQVEGSQDGIAPPLLTPTLISPQSGTTCVWVRGYWHKGHWTYHPKRWHRGYWVKGHDSCSGGGASSFSIEAGTPVS